MTQDDAGKARLQLLMGMRLKAAQDDGDFVEALAVLKDWARQEPDNEKVARLIETMASRQADAPAVVCIERVRTAGRALRNPEGQVYIEEPGGRLRPATGEDLARAEARFPGFLKQWRLDTDEWEDGG